MNPNLLSTVAFLFPLGLGIAILGLTYREHKIFSEVCLNVGFFVSTACAIAVLVNLSL